MLILTGAIGGVITAVIEIIFLCESRTVKTYIHRIIRSVFAVDLISLAIVKYVFHFKHFLTTEKCTTATYIQFFILSLCVGAVLLVLSGFVNRRLTFEEEKSPKKKGLAIFVKILSCIFTALGCAAYFGTIWGKGAFGDVTADQLIINLFSPTEGTDVGVYIEGFEGPVFQTMLITTIFAIIVFSKFSIKYHKGEKAVTVFSGLARRIICFVLSVAMLSGGIAYGVQKFQLVQLYRAYCIKSDIVEETYVDPETAQLTFPEQKRNLIHIYLESLENSYLSQDLGGYMEQNLMPELTELSYEGITFSNNSTKFGGPLTATGTQWSVAAMVNMTTGLPMKVPAEPNCYGSKDNFLPGAYTLMDLLHDNGYEQTVMFGADANFGGLSYYYESHGNVKVMDYRYAKRNKLIPEDYREWWGYEDDKLYEFAKDELTRLYETGNPFNFIMETADTHRPGGYLSKNAPTPYSDHYANAIAYSTQQAVEFVRWIQEQPFYENTTIVLIGDHLSMDTDFFENFDPDYLRTQYNLILNPAENVADVNKKYLVNRQYANFDMFPTIVASMGIEIEGDRLGIGTNLFSGKQTVFEEYGRDFVNKELEKGSELYNNEILVNPNAEQSAEETTSADNAKQ